MSWYIKCVDASNILIWWSWKIRIIEIKQVGDSSYIRGYGPHLWARYTSFLLFLSLPIKRENLEEPLDALQLDQVPFFYLLFLIIRYASASSLLRIWELYIYLRVHYIYAFIN